MMMMVVKIIMTIIMISMIVMSMTIVMIWISNCKTDIVNSDNDINNTITT